MPWSQRQPRTLYGLDEATQRIFESTAFLPRSGMVHF